MIYVYNVTLKHPDPFLSVVHFKGEGDGTSKNSKRKQKRLKQKAIGDKKEAPQSKRKSVSSPDAKPTASPAAKASTQTNGSKIVANGKMGTIQTPKGKGNTNPICTCAVQLCSFSNGGCNIPPTGGGVASGFSTVDLLRKRLHEKIEESKGQVWSGSFACYFAPNNFSESTNH